VPIDFLVTQFEMTMMNMRERRFSRIDSNEPKHPAGQEGSSENFQTSPTTCPYSLECVCDGAAEFETDNSSSLKVAFVHR